jgi:cytochrome c oxidase cbb3-type subunit I/II
MELEKFSYDNKITRAFTFATLFWAVVGMLVGVIAAFQLAFPALNLGIAETTFGRLRPLHTNAVIFAFVGNGIFTAVYYSFPRVLKTRMYSDKLGWIHFWGWQIIIVLAAVTLLMGMTVSKEYAELEWPLDVLITIIWVIFGINMIGTVLKEEKDIYMLVFGFS